MSFSFANGALLWGTLLFVVPLIIHLLNRRRYKVIRWAAQQFLLLAYQRTRRRLTLESLLLLLARCLLIILLALALARPFVPGSNPLSLVSQAPRNVVLAVDVSYSMAREGIGGESPLMRAKAQARHLLESLSEDRGDEAALMTIGDPPAMVQHKTSNIEAVQDALERLETDYGTADLLRSLDFLNETVLAPSERSHDVFLFTDMQRLTFHPDSDGEGASRSGESAVATAWRRAMSDRTRFVVVDVGDDRAPRNMTVEDLSVTPENVVDGEIVTVTATVRNHGRSDERGVVGRFVQDGRREEAVRVTFDVPAGSVSSVEYSTRFSEPGSATVEFALEGDELAIDDSRYLAFPVQEAVRVLLVDGRYHPEEDLRSTGKLGVMLDPSPMDPETGPRVSVFRPETIDERRFNLKAADPADYELIVLSDVARLDPEVAQALDDAVRAGRGLWIFLGERVDAQSYNDLLHRPDGTGLLPGRLLLPIGDETAADGFEPLVTDFDHPILSVFAVPELQPMITVVPRVLRFFAVEVTPKDTATQVVIRVKDDPADPKPLALEKPAGRGRVMLWTTTADESWSTFARHGYTWLPLVQEIAAYLTLPDLSFYNLEVGGRIRRTSRTIPQRVAILNPVGRRFPITDAATEREYGEYVLPPFDDTRMPGFYELEMSFPISGAGLDAGREVIEHYAVNVRPEEGDLSRVEPDAFPVLFPGVEVEFAREVAAFDESETGSRDGELFRAILWAVVALLVAEMWMAWWFGRK